MIVETNHMLTLSRFPETFFPLINDLHGRDAQYQNPGFSLRSFIVARCLRKEYCSIPKEMIEVVNECQAFSCDAGIVNRVAAELNRRVTKIYESIAALPGHSQEKFLGSIDQLKALTEQTRKLYESYVDLGSDPMIEPGMLLKDSLYDLNEKILDVSWAVDSEIPPVVESVEDDGPELA